MTSPDEKKNKRVAAFTTLVVNGLLLVLLLFVAAWRAPDPPNPEFGIELNFGLDTQGGGDVQPEEPAGSEQPEQEIIEEETPQPQEEAPATVETKPTEQEVTSKSESPIVVKEVKETPKEPVKETKKEEKKTEPIKTEEKPKEDAKAVYKPKAESDTKTTTDKTGKEASHGDDPGKTGDKGNPEGSLDAKALYGKQGGGDGGASSLDLAGWNWDAIPKPDVPNNESGRLVFEIKVDENGEIISIRTVERSVSLEAEKICRAEVEKLTFSKTGSNVPSVSTGRITFVVRSK
jgi:outer membrane biosynthesis protein TonB